MKLKSIIIFVILLCVGAHSSFAQVNNNFKENNLEVSFGIIDSNENADLTSFGLYKFFNDGMFRGENPLETGVKFGWQDGYNYESIDYGLFNSEYFIGVRYNKVSNKFYPTACKFLDSGKIKYLSYINAKGTTTNTLSGNFTLVYKNKDVYSGFIKEGKRHGYGTYITKEGYVYKGLWVNNLREDNSAYAVFLNGKVFKGNWQKDKIENKGVLYDFEGSKSRVWKQKNKGLVNELNEKIIDDKFLVEKLDDKIEFYIKNEKAFFAKSKQNLKEKVTNKSKQNKPALVTKNINKDVERTYSESTFKGYIVNDKFEGKGKLIYKNGDYFEGYFRGGLYDGEGIYVFSNGAKLIGNFYKGPSNMNTLILEGKMVYENGEEFEGEIHLGYYFNKFKIIKPLKIETLNSLPSELESSKQGAVIKYGKLIKVSPIKNDESIKGQKYKSVESDEKKSENYEKPPFSLAKLVGIIVIFILIYYLFKSVFKGSSNSVKQSYSQYTPPKSKKTTEAPLPTQPKPRPISKFSMSESDFEEEINNQLNEIRGGNTKIYWVGDEHRTHPWSLQPGGCTVVVLFKDKNCFGYDKVKRPDRYTRKISKDYVSNHYSNSRFSSLEDYINEIYLTSHSGVDLKRVWHSNMGSNPWAILEKYRTK
ncbi:MORN repeat-containing protein [Formosa algae]|uniref:hypothetical protein n=1 Tax=Formosa algae TaxID=225843 RepID=UPI000CCF2525|nr:hypothetical protein [Formosa algae]PNW27299.1 hypothetical protein BKP44_13695 [Formosa algae]